MQISLSRRRVLGLIAAASTVVAPAAGRAQTANLVRIGSTPSDSFAEPYFAADQGYFTRAGLNAPITNFSAGGPIVQAAAAGAVDVGIGDSIAVATAVRAGVPFVFFAGCGMYKTEAPTTLMCVPKTSPFRTPKDIEGNTVAVANISSISTIAVKLWLDTNGADLTKIKFFELPQAEMAPALVRGTVSAAFLNETFFTGQRDNIKIFAKPYDSIGKSFLISGWFANRDWLSRNPDTARKLVRAIYDSARWANAHQDDTAVILSKYSGMDVARIRGINRTVFATGIDPSMFQAVLDAATKYGLLTAHVNAADLIATIPA
jgi:NitT/TauT family transport system substrate-binding protein